MNYTEAVYTGCEEKFHVITSHFGSKLKAVGRLVVSAAMLNTLSRLVSGPPSIEFAYHAPACGRGERLFRERIPLQPAVFRERMPRKPDVFWSDEITSFWSDKITSYQWTPKWRTKGRVNGIFRDA